MKFYTEYIKNVFKQNLTYRFSYFMELIGTVTGFIVQYYIWKALLKNNSSATNYGAISFSDMTTYILVSMIVSTMVSSGVIGALGQKILTGAIAMDIIKPVNIKGMFFAGSIGENLCRFLFILIPVGILGIGIFGIALPAPINFIFFLLSLAGAIFLYFYISYALGLLAFWFTKIYILNNFLMDITRLFSGAFIPIWFFPQWLQAISGFLPFQFIYFVPISIFMNQYSPRQCVSLLLIQLVWILGLHFLGKVIWNKGIGKNVILGG